MERISAKSLLKHASCIPALLAILGALTGRSAGGGSLELHDGAAADCVQIMVTARGEARDFRREMPSGNASLGPGHTPLTDCHGTQFRDLRDVQAPRARNGRRSSVGESIAPGAPDLVNWLENIQASPSSKPAIIEVNRRIRCPTWQPCPCKRLASW